MKIFYRPDLMILSFLAFLMPDLLFSQITITSSSMPSSNDTIRFSVVDMNDSVNYLQAGANKTWDFSDVNIVASGLYEYKSATSVNLTYGLFFGLTSYGLKILDTLDLGAIAIYDMYDFYSKSNSVFKAVGRGLEFQGVPQPSFFSNDDEIYQFPLSFGDRDSSNFAVTFNFNLVFSLTQSGHRINEAEGWGTVSTPFGTYQALKIKTTIVERDSVTVAGTGLPAITRTTVEYKWLAKEEKIPVFEVTGSLINGNYTPLLMRYRGTPNNFASMKAFQVKNDFKAWPNPCHGELHFNLPVKEEAFELKLTDINGKEFVPICSLTASRFARI